MTTGALIFAINNGTIDYEAMAHWSAQNIQRHLGIATRIVTQNDVDQAPAGNRWFADFDTHMDWHNQARADAYDLSPWDRTLLLDADYVVASDCLAPLLHSNLHILAHDRAHDITGVSDFADQNSFGMYRMPMWWATVMIFDRSVEARLLFDSMRMIRQNWDHYRHIYHNPKDTFRNDHALTTALGMINGHVLDHAAIPWSLASLLPQCELSLVKTDHYRVTYQNQGRRWWLDLAGQDFHAMGKRSLGDIVAGIK